MEYISGELHAVGPPPPDADCRHAGRHFLQDLHTRSLSDPLECHLLGKSSVSLTSTLEGTSKRLLVVLVRYASAKKVGFGKSLCIDAALHYGLRYGHAVGYMYLTGAVHTHAPSAGRGFQSTKPMLGSAVLGAVHKQRERCSFT